MKNDKQKKWVFDSDADSDRDMDEVEQVSWKQ